MRESKGVIIVEISTNKVNPVPNMHSHQKLTPFLSCRKAHHLQNFTEIRPQRFEIRGRQWRIRPKSVACRRVIRTVCGLDCAVAPKVSQDILKHNLSLHKTCFPFLPPLPSFLSFPPALSLSRCR